MTTRTPAPAPTRSRRPALGLLVRVAAAAAGGFALWGAFPPRFLWWLAILGLALFYGAVGTGRPRARVGANAVVTRDVPAGAVMVGIPARPTMVEGGAAETPSRFVPYGTPCSEMFDPATQKIEMMRCELESMRKRLDALLAERADDAVPQAERDRA